MFKSGALLTIGNLSSAVLLMVRNILIARLISVADMGVASTFAITMAVLEMVTDFALNQMLIQDRDGENPRLKGTLQLLQFLRGLIAGAVLYLFAAPYAALLGVGDIAWAFQIMALIPVIRGLAHLDIFQAQRNMEYRPYLMAIVGSQIVSLLAVWPMVQLTGDFRAMLYVLLIQHTVYLVLTHVVATSRFAFVWEKEIFWRAFHFGWPLLLNGGLMFLILCGDRVIVANLLSMTDLGLFAMAVTVSMAPTLVIGKTLQAFFLPQLSRVQDKEAAFNRLYPVVLETYFTAGVVFAAGVALIVPPLFVLLLGEKYIPALTLLIWLSMMQGIRVSKGGPAMVALARSHTRNPMIGNLVRLAALPVAWFAVSRTGDVMTIAWVALVGEILALIVSYKVMEMAVKVSLKPVFPGLATMTLLMSVIGIDSYIAPPAASFADHFHSFQWVILGAMVLHFLAVSHMRNWFLSRFFKGANAGQKSQSETKKPPE